MSASLLKPDIGPAASMSAMGHELTHAVQQNPCSFDHLVGPGAEYGAGGSDDGQRFVWCGTTTVTLIATLHSARVRRGRDRSARLLPRSSRCRHLDEGRRGTISW